MKKLLPHKPAVRIALVVFIALFILFQCARATQPHTRFDAGARIARGETAYVMLSVVYPGPTERTAWQGGMLLVGSSNDPDYGPDANNLALYGMLVVERWRIGLGLGAAQWWRESPYSGTRTQAALMLRFNVLRGKRGRCDVQHFHLSNAGIRRPNPGWELPGVGCSLQW